MRKPPVVFVFNIVEHGRRWYRTLVFVGRIVLAANLTARYDFHGDRPRSCVVTPSFLQRLHLRSKSLVQSFPVWAVTRSRCSCQRLLCGLTAAAGAVHLLAEYKHGVHRRLPFESIAWRAGGTADSVTYR